MISIQILDSFKEIKSSKECCQKSLTKCKRIIFFSFLFEFIGHITIFNNPWSSFVDDVHSYGFFPVGFGSVFGNYFQILFHGVTYQNWVSNFIEDIVNSENLEIFNTSFFHTCKTSGVFKGFVETSITIWCIKNFSSGWINRFTSFRLTFGINGWERVLFQK